jgi:hypothetical protein
VLLELITRLLIYISEKIENILGRYIYKDNKVLGNIRISIENSSYERDLKKLTVYVKVVNSTYYLNLEVTYFQIWIDGISQATTYPRIIRRNEDAEAFDFPFFLTEGQLEELRMTLNTQNNLRVNGNILFRCGNRKLTNGFTLYTTVPMEQFIG